MDHAIAACIFTVWVTSALYVSGYGTTAPWWRSAAGRSLFSLGVVLFVLSSLAAAGVLFGQDYEFRPIARLAGWGATAAVSVGLLVTWYRARRRP